LSDAKVTQPVFSPTKTNHARPDRSYCWNIAHLRRSLSIYAFASISICSVSVHVGRRLYFHCWWRRVAM